MKENIDAIILASGESSRFWPLAHDKHKSMYEIMGKPVISHTVEALAKIGVTHVIIVTRPSDSSIKDYLKDGKELGVDISYVIQEKPLGMGNAIQSAQDSVKSNYFFVSNADQVNADELAPKMIETLKSKKNIDSVLASQHTETPFNYGILEIENGMAKGIEEKPKKGTEKSNQMVIGIYLLAKRFLDTLNETETSQYAYEEALENYIKKYNSTAVCSFENIPEITLKLGWHLFNVNKYLMDKLLKTTQIHESAEISPTAIIKGNVHIGKNVKIFEHAVINGPCYINDDAIIGNNSLIRDYSYIGRKSIVGFNTEIKHSIMYDNVETHMNYIGDTIVDQNTAFGAGSITANRRLDRRCISTMVKGKNVDTNLSFFGSIVGRDVHTGIHTSIMPGIKIGAYSNIGSQTVLTKDVPEKTFVYIKQESIRKKSK